MVFIKQNKVSKDLLFRINLTVKLVDGRMSKNLLVPNLQYCQFEQPKIAEKTEPLSWISWIWLVVKYFENLVIEKSLAIMNDAD